MVKQRRKLRPRKGTNMRVALRQLHQAVTDTAVLVRAPADPPPIRAYRTFTITVQFVLINGDTYKVDMKALPEDNVITTPIKANEEIHVQLGSPDFRNAWVYGMGAASYDDAKTPWQVALVKASIWGPNPQQQATSVELLANSGSAVRAATDHGSPIARPRVSIGFPKLDWAGNASVQARMTPHSIEQIKEPGTVVGIMQLTLAGRRAAKLF